MDVSVQRDEGGNASRAANFCLLTVKHVWHSAPVVRPSLTRAELMKRARAKPLPVALDNGASYDRWYKARRRLGMATARKVMEPEQRDEHRRTYMRLLMRARRKAEREQREKGKGNRKG